MTTIHDAPNGVTGDFISRTGEAMSDRLQNRGWRKAGTSPTAAETFAKAAKDIAIPKARAIVAVKRVAAHIGLKAADVLLIDTLSAFSQTQDWSEGRSPVVWPSNALLMDQTGMSLSTLKRHLRRLSALGLVAFRDSPNGKRWGRRNPRGEITEAYGFDLSPLATRATEFEALYNQIAEEREKVAMLKRKITIARRAIRARFDAALACGLGEIVSGLIPTFETLLGRLPKSKTTSEYLADLYAAFSSLIERIEATFQQVQPRTQAVENKRITSENSEETDPKGAKNDPHLQTTNELQIVSNRDTHGKTRQSPKQFDQADDETFSMLHSACPEFMAWTKTLGLGTQSWADLHRGAGQLAPMIGISTDAWEKAQDALGHQTATRAVILTFEKHSAGEVKHPSGYLRGLMRKGQEGSLHLSRSFYGRRLRMAA